MTMGTQPPYPDDQNQINLDNSVEQYNDAVAQEQADTALRLSYISYMLQLMGEGQMDAAMVVAQVDVLPMVIQESVDEQNIYACSEAIGASLDAFSTTDEECFDEGSTYTGDPNTDNGMSAEAEQTFEEDQSDLWWDLNCTSYSFTNPSTGTEMSGSDNFLNMIDPTSKSQLSDSVSDIVYQYGYQTSPDDNIDWIDENGNPIDVSYMTDEMWAAQGNDGEAPQQNITSITNDFQNQTNTCNAQEQSANSLLQNQIQLTNTYIGNEENVLSCTQDQDQVMVGNQKVS